MKNYTSNYKAKITIECKKVTHENLVRIIEWLHERLNTNVSIGYNYKREQKQTFTNADSLCFQYPYLSDKKYQASIGEYIVLYILAEKILKVIVLEDWNETNMYYTGDMFNIEKVIEREGWEDEL